MPNWQAGDLSAILSCGLPFCQVREKFTLAKTRLLE
jgi:hypothetical protein